MPPPMLMTYEVDMDLVASRVKQRTDTRSSGYLRMILYR